MYDNVIVPFDGSLPGRVAFAPAADLAWRCGARLVVVNNSDVSDKASRAAIKSRAMSMSGADVDFWVDPDGSLGDALVKAARARGNAVVCLALPPKHGLLRKSVLSSVAEDVLRGTTAPVMVVGPQADTSRGLPLVDLVVALDGSPAAEAAIAFARDLGAALKMQVHVVGVATDDRDAPAMEAYLADQAASLSGSVIQVTHTTLRGKQASSALVSFLESHEDALLVMGRHGTVGGRGALGDTANAVVANSPRAVVLVAAPSA